MDIELINVVTNLYKIHLENNCYVNYTGQNIILVSKLLEEADQ